MRVFKRTVFLICLAFAYMAESPRVVSVKAEPRWPWNGLVDITCNMNGITGGGYYTCQLKGYERNRN